MINIVNKVDCCGCEACSNACPKKCIEMKSDEEGFLYPQVNQDTCINCGLCEKVCPIINHVPREKNDYQEAYLLQHKDDEICRESTAGGAFTGIASYVIEKGGIVFGVEMTEGYKVRHTSVETIDDLKKFRNSKYVQSRIGTVFQQVKHELNKGRLVCFSGTPCQVEGLRHFLGKDYENLILVDVVCRAVPSPGVWEKYIQYEVEQKGEMSSVRFRDKTLGYQYSTMELKSNDGKAYRGGIESQPWLRMFFSGMIIRPSCTDCKFRSRYRNSDFTIWDCFPSYKFDKSFNERKGTTRVLVHSEKGKAIFETIKKEYYVSEINADYAVSGVSEMVKSPQSNEKKNDFFEYYSSVQMDEILKMFFPYTVKVQVKRLLRRILNYLRLDVVVKKMLKRG